MQRSGTQHVKVIVQYKRTPQPTHWARVQAIGGHLSSKLHLINSTAYSVPANRLQELANDPDVDFVSVDHPLKGFDDYTDAAVNSSAFTSLGYDGSGITVAVIDSGINNQHADL